MTFKHGKDTEVWVDGVDLSGYFRGADFSADVDTAETTTFKKTWKTALPGQASATYDLEGLYDPTLGTVKDLLPTTAATLTVGPAGMAAIDDVARLVSIYSTTYGESAPVGDVVAFKWAVLARDTVGFGHVLHPLTEDTNTTTGADKDDAAATSTGWTAHLHVSAVDAGSWVVKLQDAATTDWTDVTGGAFTAATGVTSQRLSGAAGATLRRHVRYVATRTGGSAGDGITFGLAYSRN